MSIEDGGIFIEEVLIEEAESNRAPVIRLISDRARKPRKPFLHGLNGSNDGQKHAVRRAPRSRGRAGWR